MKTNILKHMSLLLVLAVAASCGGNDEPGADDAKSKKVSTLTSSKWVTQSVSHKSDGDLTFQYEDFSLTLINNPIAGADGDYVVIQGGNAFPDPSGKWILSEDMNTIFLTNGQELSIKTVTDQSLVLNFVVVPDAGGRIEGVSGEFTFNLKH